MSKIPLLIIVAAVLLGVAVVGAPLAGGAVASGPQQPVEFTHLTHAKNLGLECAFCHRNVEKGASASVPAVGQCMFCHKVVNKDNPQVSAAKGQEIEKVRQAFEKGEPINWVRVHRVPDHVRFVHEAHIQAGFQCQTCHGDKIAESTRVAQVRALNMGDCVNCHRQNGAPTDCTICHK